MPALLKSLGSRQLLPPECSRAHPGSAATLHLPSATGAFILPLAAPSESSNPGTDLPPPPTASPSTPRPALTLKVYMYKGCTRDAHRLGPRMRPDRRQGAQSGPPTTIKALAGHPGSDPACQLAKTQFGTATRGWRTHFPVRRNVR